MPSTRKSLVESEGVCFYYCRFHGIGTSCAYPTRLIGLMTHEEYANHIRYGHVMLIGNAVPHQIEAKKHWSLAKPIRMAVGQLLDYSRFVGSPNWQISCQKYRDETYSPLSTGIRSQ